MSKVIKMIMCDCFPRLIILDGTAAASATNYTNYTKANNS